MRLVFLSAIACAAAATAGCGDGKGSTGTSGVGGGGGSGGSAASCTGVETACGGDVVGTWAIVKVCDLFLITPGTPLCTGIEYIQSALTETGTVTFGADGTVTEDLTGTGTLREVVPSTCFEVLGTCAEIDARYQMVVGQGVYTSAGCASAASGSCECSAAFRTTATVSGTYTTSGSTLTLMNTTNTSSPASYCVQGSTMGLSVASQTGGPPVVYVFTRQ
jgi:hypothetical protein